MASIPRIPEMEGSRSLGSFITMYLITDERGGKEQDTGGLRVHI